MNSNLIRGRTYIVYSYMYILWVLNIQYVVCISLSSPPSFRNCFIFFFLFTIVNTIVNKKKEIKQFWRKNSCIICIHVMHSLLSLVINANKELVYVSKQNIKILIEK